MDPAGKVALITGGAHRVGRVLTLALARAGADIVIDYHTSGADADATARDVEALGRRAIALRADVSIRSDVEHLIDGARSTFGRLDILVNSASLFERTAFEYIREVDWDRVLAVNLKGPFLLSQAAAPLLRADGGGVIVNIADLSAFQAWPSHAHHAVSKAGLVHLTRIMARALAPHVRANCIAPGTVLPPQTADAATDEDGERRITARAGRAEDVADALLYLVRSDFVTGEVLVVDGGRSVL